MDSDSEHEEHKVIKKVIDVEPPSEDQKKYKYGIVYLSYVPDGLTVKIIRDIMSRYGEVGRIFLQPEPSNATSKRKKYIEGWVEFKKKRVAKQIAEDLNGTELDYGRKHSILSGQIWSIKYLHRFKWTNLTERLSMEKGSREQKRHYEMMETKKQADFYQKMTERSSIMKKRKQSQEGELDINKDRVEALKSRQKKPKSNGTELSVNVDSELLSSIFKRVA